MPLPDKPKFSDFKQVSSIQGNMYAVGVNPNEPNASDRNARYTFEDLRRFLVTGQPTSPGKWVSQPTVTVTNNGDGTATVSVTAGTAEFNGLTVEYDATSYPAVQLPAQGLQRQDAVAAKEDGTYAYVTGTDAQNPATPAIPAGSLLANFILLNSSGGDVTQPPTQVTVVDRVEDGNLEAVTSNAVYDFVRASQAPVELTDAATVVFDTALSPNAGLASPALITELSFLGTRPGHDYRVAVTGVSADRAVTLTAGAGYGYRDLSGNTVTQVTLPAGDCHVLLYHESESVRRVAVLSKASEGPTGTFFDIAATTYQTGHFNEGVWLDTTDQAFESGKRNAYTEWDFRGFNYGYNDLDNAGVEVSKFKVSESKGYDTDIVTNTGVPNVVGATGVTDWTWQFETAKLTGGQKVYSGRFLIKSNGRAGIYTAIMNDDQTVAKRYQWDATGYYVDGVLFTGGSNVTLYSATGQNTDGAMTQKAVSDELALRVKTVNGTAPDGNGNVVVSGGGSVTVDTELSNTSQNPLTNQKTTEELQNRPTFTQTPSLSQAQKDAMVVGEVNVFTATKQADGSVSWGAGVGTLNKFAPDSLDTLLQDSAAGWQGQYITLTGDNTNRQLGKAGQEKAFKRRWYLCKASTDSSATWERNATVDMLNSADSYDQTIIAELENESGWIDNIKQVTVKSCKGDEYTSDSGYVYTCYSDDNKWRRIGQPKTAPMRVDATTYPTLTSKLLAHDFNAGFYDAKADASYSTFKGEEGQIFWDRTSRKMFRCIISNSTEIIWEKIR
jgi:hypothetical protein